MSRINTKWVKMLVAVMLIAIPHNAALAQQARDYCKAEKATKINVRPMSSKVKYDYSMDLKQLQTIQSDTINPYGFGQSTQTRGLMRGAIQIVGPNIVFSRKQIGRTGEYACAWFDEINIQIKIDPAILIAKEVAADRCMHKAVKKHELGHVKIDRQIVNKYALSIGQKVNEALKSRGYGGGPVKLEDLEGLQNSMARVVTQVVELEQQKMQIERTERQRAYDNLDEYETVSKTCKGFSNL